VVEPGTNGLRRIVEEFGPEVLSEDGSLDRKKLGAIVFAEPEKRILLNSIVHPLVIEKQDEWIRRQEAADPDGMAIIDAALMIESGGYKRLDKLIVVWCEPDIQLARLIERDQLTVEEARRRIDAQMPQDEKKKYADFLIDTSEGFEDTRRRVAETFKKLRHLTL
jgi:dephospho-CoA kinase